MQNSKSIKLLTTNNMQHQADCPPPPPPTSAKTTKEINCQQKGQPIRIAVDLLHIRELPATHAENNRCVQSEEIIDL